MTKANPPIEITVRQWILLYQKERQEVASSPGLPKVEQLDYTQLLSSTAHLRAHPSYLRQEMVH